MKEITDSNYNNLIKGTDNPIILILSSPLCGPCQILKDHIPNIEALLAAENLNAEIYECDITKNPRIQKKYDVRSTPTVLIIDKEKKIVYADAGFNVDRMYKYVDIVKKLQKKKKGFFSRFFS